ncbi:hypothetical protein LNTAR_16157 [Lentisphaera araneosa HTCC2155]|uniref:Uncharacterized protein n=1 Tax=Lentisphaera araneosa HTCC2155 TaxID=313628 RepID=A6DMM9_9BACT|nr:hypothetical protein [Lentisphaera araneosa]EDM27219.1 hypothetical protein LNTAR_16157 [Lentisphaera araneosa HTCC2155]
MQKWTDKFNKTVQRFAPGSRRPDIMILKKSKDSFKNKFLSGSVETIVDLKTGAKGLEDAWVGDVAQRLNLPPNKILYVRQGENLKKGYRIAQEAVEQVREAQIRGGGLGGKALGKSLLIAGVFLAYNDAIANGMEGEKALAYAASSVVGGDIIYDTTEYSG